MTKYQKEGWVVAFVAFILFLTILFSDPKTLGMVISSSLQSKVTSTSLVGAVIFLILSAYIYINKSNAKSFLQSTISAVIIFGAIYLFVYLIRDANILISLLVLTFGVWAIIWTIIARNSLSKGSTLRSYVTSFIFCVLFILIFAIWDLAMFLFEIKSVLATELKQIFLILAFTSFVHASYKILKIGREFGFSEESYRIKKLLKAKKSNIK